MVNEMKKISLRGAIDMHVHSAPDIRQRAYTDIELMEAAVRVGARAVVIKSHHGTTMNRAFLVNEMNRIMHGTENNLTVFGSITLNRPVGGLNPAAVETALKMGAKVVWLPTTHASNEMARQGKTGGIECVSGGRIVEPLKEIFKMIKDYDVVLGTAHLSPGEIFVVTEAAKNMGINKIVITHPEWPTVNMSLEDQVKITKDYDVYLEKCYAHALGGGKYQKNLSDNLVVIKEAGCKNVIISTDGGQVENPHWEMALAEYHQFLADNGIPGEDIDYMGRSLPARLLGIAQ
jgi:hypothetical protein